MPLVLTRIDDRLIHGQVVVGWGNYLKPDRIVLCSDSVATVPWQKEIYSAAGTLAPDNVKISIWTEKETIDYFSQQTSQEENVILLVESPQDIVNLINRGVDIVEVNIGGMHYKHGKKQLAPFIFVDDSDLNNFKVLANRQIKLDGQDVPTSKKINIAKILESI